MTPPASQNATFLLYIHNILKDGEWHLFDDVMKAAIPKVPRGMAARRADVDRARAHKRRYGPDSSPPPRRVTERTVRAGARTLLRGSFRGCEQWFETQGKGANKKIRMKATPTHLLPYVPEKDRLGGGVCPTCGQRQLDRQPRPKKK